MKTISKIFNLCVVGMVVLLLSAFSRSAGATARVQVCATWTSQYVDVAFGEDNFTGPGQVQRGAALTRYVLYNLTDGTNQAGFLDINGCAIAWYLPNKAYRFVQATWVGNGNRHIWVNPDDGTWDGRVVSIYYDWISPGSLQDNAIYLAGIPLVWVSPKANIMPVAAHLVNSYSQFGFPDTLSTRVRTDIDVCTGGGAYTESMTKVCVTGGSQGTGYEWEDCTTWKYTISHEFGHAVANALTNTSLFAGGYDHPVNEAMCKCDHIGDYGPHYHCLQSREFVHTAQSEGFANFFSAAMMNARNENDGIYVHCKPAWKYLGGAWRNDVMPPNAWWAFQIQPEVNTDRWMQKYCYTGDNPEGVELDWLRFFYEIWTSGSSKFSINEMSNVWNSVTDPYYGWENQPGSLKQSCSGLWSEEDPKCILFRAKAVQAGVNNG